MCLKIIKLCCLETVLLLTNYETFIYTAKHLLTEVDLFISVGLICKCLFMKD